MSIILNLAAFLGNILLSYESTWMEYNNNKTNEEIKSIILYSIKTNQYGKINITQTIYDSYIYQTGWNYNKDIINKVLDNKDILKKFNKLNFTNNDNSYLFYTNIILEPDFVNKILNIKFDSYI
jgi:hypothetical protein